ncbi:protein ALP1-like isoform X1 [Oryza brachyantha]|uniref:protein ALP1-like isoform X1 n=1 Tax=Oryza brachyantha TaxID=4533 RepID=UPI001ADB51BC|nr:protein ALP1-like isoform X1 [Oryza brachyantha]
MKAGSITMDERKQLYLQYFFNYYYQYCIWKRRLLVAIAICLASYSYLVDMRKKQREGVTYSPMLLRDVERNARLNCLFNGTEANCVSELRMRKAIFHRLCGHLRSCGLLVDTLHVTVEEQVAMFMHVVGHKWSNRFVGFEFYQSGETVSRYFNAVLDSLVSISKELIYLRSTETHPKITSSPGRFHPYFEGCIGALDGTHVPVCVPAHMQNRFWGRKSSPTQNVLAAVDFDLRFIYVLAGWEGLAHDSHVLQDALSRPSGLKIPEGKFFLADAGYAARPGILPPYCGVRYHLKEYKDARQPENDKELFNLHLVP